MSKIYLEILDEPRRAVWRDYVDLFLLLKKQIMTLDKIIEMAKQKFTSEFNTALFLEQLTYFADIEVTPIEYIGNSFSPEDIKVYLESQLNAYLKKVLP